MALLLFYPFANTKDPYSYFSFSSLLFQNCAAILLINLGWWAQLWLRAPLKTALHREWGCILGLLLQVAAARGNTRLQWSTASSTGICSKKAGTRTGRAEVAAEGRAGQGQDLRAHYMWWKIRSCRRIYQVVKMMRSFLKMSQLPPIHSTIYVHTKSPTAMPAPSPSAAVPAPARSGTWATAVSTPATAGPWPGTTAVSTCGKT
jgi:hypothetical protein